MPPACFEYPLHKISQPKRNRTKINRQRDKHIDCGNQKQVTLWILHVNRIKYFTGRQQDEHRQTTHRKKITDMKE